LSSFAAGGGPAFSVAVAFLFVIQQRSGGTCFFAVAVALAFLVVIPEGDLRLSLSLP
jgi:hypothetical protein